MQYAVVWCPFITSWCSILHTSPTANAYRLSGGKHIDENPMESITVVPNKSGIETRQDLRFSTNNSLYLDILKIMQDRDIVTTTEDKQEVICKCCIKR